jgi:hypothetical protein
MPHQQLDKKEFKEVFNNIYQHFYEHHSISEVDQKVISNQSIEIEEFDVLTERKQYQRYISLLDGRIIFHEIPNAPHGEVIAHVHDAVWSQLDHATFQGCSDNDLPLSNIFKKRPDSSCRIRQSRLPNPLPPSIKIIPGSIFNVPFQSIVIDVAVNHESLAMFQRFADSYFSAHTSINVWIGVKIWIEGKKYWVGWAERQAGSTGCTIHSQTAWPPQHSSILTPINLIYNIPMDLVYGAIPIPPGAPNALQIDVESIRTEILEIIQ